MDLGCLDPLLHTTVRHGRRDTEADTPRSTASLRSWSSFAVHDRRSLQSMILMMKGGWKEQIDKSSAKATGIQHPNDACTNTAFEPAFQIRLTTEMGVAF